MFRKVHFFYILGALLGLRLISMAFYPLTDTSEPRYAEVARLMVLTHDWITPWFSPDVPFWGKPPLSFWAQALSFKLLGLTEFAARFPGWLATVLALGLTYKLASAQFGSRVGQLSALIFGSCTLVFVTSGAVLTDPFFALATTWAMVAYVMAQSRQSWVWRYGFFAALALGLLTKGPLMGVLVAGPIFAGLVVSQQARRDFLAMPWFSGTVVMLLLSAPWYVLAELKTPGFLAYFLVGEHFYRFIDPGWAGDLYGTAHREPKGRIWLDFVVAASPWSLVAVPVLFHKLTKPAAYAGLKRVLTDPIRFYLVCWALFTLVFFTLSGNILWTYVWPVLPAFSILLALALQTSLDRSVVWRLALVVLMLASPLACTLAFSVWASDPQTLKTEKYLVAQAFAQMSTQDELAYVGPVPFSASFYSERRATSIAWEALTPQARSHVLYLAVPKEALAVVGTKLGLPLEPMAQSNYYYLVKVPASTP